MAGPVSSIAQVPLHETLPPFCAAAQDELRRLMSTLERHRLAAGRTAWHWYPPGPESLEAKTWERLADGSVYLTVLDAAITLSNSGVDWLELTVDIAWRTPQHLTVNAAVEVACWCPKDHNMHPVRQVQRPVSNSAELIDGFAVGATMLSDVLDSGPYDPGPWRIEAGLPDAP